MALHQIHDPALFNAHFDSVDSRANVARGSIASFINQRDTDPQFSACNTWSLIVRDRKLTGPWAGFSFKAGRLVTPEGRELEPQDLAWLSLTAAQAQEWRRMMESGRAIGKPRKPLSFNAASVVNLSDALAHRREKRSSMAMAGPDAEPPAAVLPVPGPKRRQRV